MILLLSATHNFVSLKKVVALNISVTESSDFGVTLGNEDAIKDNGV